jgi:hypothetical protein
VVLPLTYKCQHHLLIVPIKKKQGLGNSLLDLRGDIFLTQFILIWISRTCCVNECVFSAAANFATTRNNIEHWNNDSKMI